MVIIKIFGGLGNQMFQFAFSIGFLMRGIEVKYDTSSFTMHKIHNGLELTRVFERVELPLAGHRDLFFFVKSQIVDGEKNYAMLPDRSIRNEYRDEEFRFIPELQSLDNVYFSGYWQHVSYFENYESEIRRLFRFCSLGAEDTLNAEMLFLIENTNSVAIHVRRGDYLNLDTYRILDGGYYGRAMKKVSQYVANPIFFVFSDDSAWARANITGDNVFHVEGNYGENAFQDMHLMSRCRHNIIANSTFSWWAAWLNTNMGKVVVAPSSWFKDDRSIEGLQLSGNLLIPVIQ